MEEVYILSIKEDLYLCVNKVNGAIYLKSINNGNPIIYTQEYERFYLFMFPLLQLDYQIFLTTFNGIIDANNVPLTKFPLTRFLQEPFKLRMNYWINLALDWIVSSDCKSDLNDWALSIDISYCPLELRHKFRKLFPRS